MNRSHAILEVEVAINKLIDTIKEEGVEENKAIGAAAYYSNEILWRIASKNAIAEGRIPKPSRYRRIIKEILKVDYSWTASEKIWRFILEDNTCTRLR